MSEYQIWWIILGVVIGYWLVQVAIIDLVTYSPLPANNINQTINVTYGDLCINNHYAPAGTSVNRQGYYVYKGVCRRKYHRNKTSNKCGKSRMVPD